MKSSTAIRWGTWCLLGALIGYATVSWAGPSITTPTRVELLMKWLKVTPEQRMAIEQADPTFIAESASLVKQLLAERTKLADMLRAGAESSAISAQLENAMAVEETLERRTGQYVLNIRPVLKVDQQQKLLDLVAQGLTDNAGAHLRDPVVEPAK